MPIKRNSNLCIVRKVLGTDIEIHLTETEVRALYDEVCRRSRDAHIGVMKTMLKESRKNFPKMPNEHEVNA